MDKQSKHYLLVGLVVIVVASLWSVAMQMKEKDIIEKERNNK